VVVAQQQYILTEVIEAEIVYLAEQLLKAVAVVVLGVEILSQLTQVQQVVEVAQAAAQETVKMLVLDFDT
jgi:hypothetical protein